MVNNFFMIKELLRKHLLEHAIEEAEAMNHFNQRVDEVLYTISMVKVPETVYVPNVPKEDQDDYIMRTIQDEMQEKINSVLAKKYPVGGSCIVAPLGQITIQPLKGAPVRPLIYAVKGEKSTVYGVSYYVSIYDNRATSLVLANPNYPENKSSGGQLLAHIRNAQQNGYKYNRDKSFVDTEFNTPLVIPMSTMLS
jgi:hypothetical protein